MKKIKLSNSKKKVFVDDEDFHYLSRFRWRLSSKASGSKRAIQHIRVGKQVLDIAMERFIIGTPPRNQFIMHKNRNSLDNRKENLVTGWWGNKNHYQKKQGTLNGRVYTSIYKGVCKPKDAKKWYAYISIGKQKQIKIGYFYSEKEAALAYDEKARELYGEFAYQNFPKKK